MMALSDELDQLCAELENCRDEVRKDEIFERIIEIADDMDLTSDAHGELTHGAIDHCADMF